MSVSKSIAAAIQCAVKKNAKDNEEAVAGYAKLDSKDQLQLLELLQRARNLGDGMLQVEVPTEKKKANRRQTGLISLVKRIREVLLEYNREENRLHDIEVDLAFILSSLETDFRTTEDRVARSTLKRYDMEGSKNNFIALLICYAKGKLLTEFKVKHGGNFKNHLREMLEYPYETARRYIEFSRVVVKYNLLLVSGQTYAELSAYLKEIESYAESESEFGSLLKLGLRDIKCGSKELSFEKLTDSFENLAVVSIQKNKRSKKNGEGIVTPGHSVAGNKQPQASENEMEHDTEGDGDNEGTE
jgi:hypothetical protein